MNKVKRVITILFTAFFLFNPVIIGSAQSNVAIGINGEVIKTVDISTPDMTRTIEIIGKFETEYNSWTEHHFFVDGGEVSTQLSGIVGTWKQTGYHGALIDGGRTYSLSIEGVYTLNGESFEKSFNIEFYCDAEGRIY